MTRWTINGPRPTNFKPGGHKEKIWDYLASQAALGLGQYGASSLAIAQATGIQTTCVQSACTDLKKSGHIVKAPKPARARTRPFNPGGRRNRTYAPPPNNAGAPPPPPPPGRPAPPPPPPRKAPVVKMEDERAELMVQFEKFVAAKVAAVGKAGVEAQWNRYCALKAHAMGNENEQESKQARTLILREIIKELEN
jgi:hypothetical protein